MSFKYKLVKNPLTGEIDSITHNIDSGHKQSIPIVVDNTDYQQFLQDVKNQGIGIVEYPPLEEQLDKIYHSTLTAWKADIKAIKDKYPKTITGGSTVGDVPAWVQTEVDKLNS